MAAENGDAALKRLAKIFLGAIEKLKESFIIKQLDDVRDLVTSGYLDLNTPIKKDTQSGMLHTACWYLRPNLTRWLLQHGAKPTRRNTNGHTPLSLACERADQPHAKEIIQMCLDYGGDLQSKCKMHSKTCIEKAAAVGVDISQFKGALKQSVNIDTAESRAKKKQAAAAAEEDEQVLKGAILAFRQLCKVVTGDDEAAFVQLLEANAEHVRKDRIDLAAPAMDNAQEDTLLHLVIRAQWVRAAELLVDSTQRATVVDAQNVDGDSALHLACDAADTPRGKTLVTLLLDAGADTSLGTYLMGVEPFDRAPDVLLKQWMQEYDPQPRPMTQVSLAGVDGETKDAAIVSASAPSRAIAKQLEAHLDKVDSDGHNAEIFASMYEILNEGAAQDSLEDEERERRREIRRRERARRMESEEAHHALLTGEGAASLFDSLDLAGSGVIGAAQLADAHRQLHGGCGLEDGAVRALVKHSKTGAEGRITRSNFESLLKLVHVACHRRTELQWDFRVLDPDRSGVLPVQGPGERLWKTNLFDARQTEYEDFLASNAAAKGKRTYVSWLEARDHLLTNPVID